MAHGSCKALADNGKVAVTIVIVIFMYIRTVSSILLGPKSCSDQEVLPGGDEVRIGARGVRLSGGLTKSGDDDNGDDNNSDNDDHHHDHDPDGNGGGGCQLVVVLVVLLLVLPMLLDCCCHCCHSYGFIMLYCCC